MTDDIPTGDRSGSCAFRLMPTDEPADAPSTLNVFRAAAGRASVLSYTWTHPKDGDQAGTLLLGTPDGHGLVTGAWVDSWHQPAVALLTGHDGILGYEYAPGWRWEVQVSAADGVVSMQMHNLVPEQESEPAVRYEVMRATWS